MPKYGPIDSPFEDPVQPAKGPKSNRSAIYDAFKEVGESTDEGFAGNLTCIDIGEALPANEQPYGRTMNGDEKVG